MHERRKQNSRRPSTAGSRVIPESLFKDGRSHESGPQERSSPGASLGNDVFWKTRRDFSNELPKSVGAGFKLREVDTIESQEIGAMLTISENHLWVMLHRARMALRRCLEMNWFGKQKVAE